MTWSINLVRSDCKNLTLKRELASLGNTTKIYLMDDWETKVEEYLQDLKAGIDSLNTGSENQENWQEIFRIKREIVTTLVRRFTIDRNRELHVEINLNLFKLLESDNLQRTEGENNTKGPITPTGIYLNKLDLDASLFLTVTL